MYDLDIICCLEYLELIDVQIQSMCDGISIGLSWYLSFVSMIVWITISFYDLKVYGLMDLDVQPLAPPDGSSATSVVVLYSDVSNGGRMIATVIGVS